MVATLLRFVALPVNAWHQHTERVIYRRHAADLARTTCRCGVCGVFDFD